MLTSHLLTWTYRSKTKKKMAGVQKLTIYKCFRFEWLYSQSNRFSSFDVIDNRNNYVFNIYRYIYRRKYIDSVRKIQDCRT